MASEQLNPATLQPLVSVITPFYNTGQYIAECIESVLAQSYSHWEYILVNNQSTDSSRSIAERYAREDNRIRLLDTPKFLSQGENFNAALHHISPESRYCQVLLADARTIAGSIDLLKAHAKGLAGGLEPELSIVVDVMFPMSALTAAVARCTPLGRPVVPDV